MSELAGVDLCHCLATRRSARMLTRFYDQHLAPVGINTSQFSILSLLAANSGMRAAEMAAKLVMDRTTLVRALKPLRTAGLVDAATGSGPGHELRLTPAGERRHAEGEPLWQAAQREMEDRFGRDRMSGLRAELLDLAAADKNTSARSTPAE